MCSDCVLYVMVFGWRGGHKKCMEDGKGVFLP